MKDSKEILVNQTMYFIDGDLVLRKQELSVKAFKKAPLDHQLSNNFVTFDIETINVNDKLVPYAICASDGKLTIEAFGRNQKVLFKQFLDGLLKYIKGNKLIVYAHNFSSFDGVFLLKYLLDYGKVEPLIHNGKI